MTEIVRERPARAGATGSGRSRGGMAAPGRLPRGVRGAAEAIEAVAHGDRRTSRVVGRSIGEIRMPPGTTIDALVRGEQVVIAHHDTVIEAGDHVILFLIDKRRIMEVERLFQVGITFL